MTTRRLSVASLAAITGLLIFAPAVSAASHGAAQAAHTTATATSTTDRDVPGAAVDPSKKDHDNGVGNNCDPGFGEGNQARFGTAGQAVDPRDTGCRSASGTAKNHETEGQTKGQTEELTKGQ